MTQQITYPRIPHDKKKSVKLTLAQIAEIQAYYHKYPKPATYQYLADLYHVTRVTIRYHVDEEFKKHRIKSAIDRQMMKYMHDEEYRKNCQLYRNNHTLNRIQTDPIFKAWINQKASDYSRQMNRIDRSILNEQYYLPTAREKYGTSVFHDRNQIHYAKIGRRLKRMRSFSAWRQFWKRVDKSLSFSQ